MTTHFAGLFKNRGTQIVPYCTRFAMSPKWGQTTMDHSKVDCARCAKQLGIIPAAKAAPLSPTGTCQCCFGGFKVPNKTISLHGYKRPGHGYILGRCRGEGHLPFEQSCEQTKVFRAELGQYLTSQVTYLTKLNEGQIESLTTKMRTDEKERDGYTRVQKTVTVLKGDIEKPNPFTNKGWDRVPSFDALLKTEIYHVESTIKAVTGNIIELTKRIDGWVLTELVRA